MSNVVHHNEGLLNAALARAAKQFPEFKPEDVVASIEQQHAALTANRPLVQGPMRDLR